MSRLERSALRRLAKLPKRARNRAAARRISALTLTLACVFASPPARAVMRYTGANLSGAEFGVGNGGLNLPGAYGTVYSYPTAADIDYYFGKGMNTFRLPFRWERLQRSQFADFDATELARMDAFVEHATSLGAHVMLDPHNFHRYYPDVSQNADPSVGLVGSTVPDAAFADFWGKLAAHYKSNGRVLFDLMNEPYSLPTEQVVTSQNAAIAAIRAAGASNLILVEGNAFSGAYSWTQGFYGTPNGTAMQNIVDPGENYAFDVHQYFDWNSSGATPAGGSPIHAQIGSDFVPNNTQIGVERLTSITSWLRTNGKRAFLGEFALPVARFGDGSVDATINGPRVADETLAAMLGAMNANADVWLGWSWWGAGPRWGDYMFSIQPTNLGLPGQTDSPAMPYLAPYFVGVVTDDVPGDFNLDRKVDGQDAALFRISAGQGGVALAADANGDGAVDGADILLWQRNLGTSAPASAPASSAVPEPCGLTLALAAAILVAVRTTQSPR